MAERVEPRKGDIYRCEDCGLEVEVTRECDCQGDDSNLCKCHEDGSSTCYLICCKTEMVRKQ